jgi:hypothetical protein
MSQYVFGTGQLFATPIGGGAPLRFGALQDVSVDFSGDIKELYGQYQFALDVARGKTKIEWKASSGNIDITAFNQIFFGGEVETGDELIQVFNEAGTIPAAAGPYTIVAANAEGFYADLGVYWSDTGLPLVQVSAAPATGQYMIDPATGTYTFAAADATKHVLLNYMWESTDTGGSLEITNQLLGTTPKFRLILSQVYEGKAFSLVLYSNVSDKLSLPLKQDDYLIAELSGMAQADDANRIGRITTTSVGGGGA